MNTVIVKYGFTQKDGGARFEKEYEVDGFMSDVEKKNFAYMMWLKEYSETDLHVISIEVK